MLLQGSYFSKEKKELIEQTVGKPFGLWQRIKMKGIGSQRFIVKKSNPEVENLFADQTGMKFTNIELRPNGIIFWFRVKIDNWILMMPYRSLSIYKSEGSLRLFYGEWKIELTPAHNESLDKKFIKKLMDQKSDYVAQHAMPV